MRRRRASWWWWGVLCLGACEGDPGLPPRPSIPPSAQDATADPEVVFEHDGGREPMEDAEVSSPDASMARLPVKPRFECPDDHLALSMVDVGKVKLQVACQGRGPAIVLLHGYPEFHRAWSSLIPSLVDAGFRVIAPDQRGYNLSDKPEPVSAYHVDPLVADLEGILEASGEESVLLVGHDWGGLLAFVFAHRHPERVRGLVVMNAPHPDIWGHPEVDPVQAQATANYVPLVAGPLGGLALSFVDLQLGPHLTSEESAAYHASWEQPNAALSMGKWFQANLDPKVLLPTGITVITPTLALWGLDDRFVTPSQLDHLPKFVDQLKVIRLAGVDHWITHQETDRLLKEMLAFEAGLP